MFVTLRSIKSCLLCFAFNKQAIEEEGGNPDEIIVAPDATSKKVNVTPKRAAKGNV